MSQKVFEMISRLDQETFVDFIGEGVTADGKRYFLGSNGKKYSSRLGLATANGMLRSIQKRKIAEVEVWAIKKEEERLASEAKATKFLTERDEAERRKQESHARVTAVRESGGCGIFALSTGELAACLASSGVNYWELCSSWPLVAM